MLSFLNFTFDFHGFHLKKLKIIQLLSEIARGRKFSGDQCLETRFPFDRLLMSVGFLS